MELIKQTVEEFVKITASDAPAPGGGSISALAGALAAALGQMVANLTVGRKKYAAADEEMRQLLPELARQQQALLEAVDEDSRAFDQYMDALSMPKDTQEQQEARKNAMQAGLKAAAQVPLGVAQRVQTLFPALELVVTKGNANAVTDGMVATMMARTAILGAVYNVRVNLRSIQDEAFTAALAQQCQRCQQEALAWERKILATVPFSNF
ncbi:MAG: cyclodeaminase/cyclohydrolase family protein [Faecousia sp.]